MRGAAARWLRGAAPCRRPHDSQALVYAGLDRRERQRPTLLPSGTASGAVAALKADTGAFLTAHMAAAGVDPDSGTLAAVAKRRTLRSALKKAFGV